MWVSFKFIDAVKLKKSFDDFYKVNACSSEWNCFVDFVLMKWNKVHQRHHHHRNSHDFSLTFYWYEFCSSWAFSVNKHQHLTVVLWKNNACFVDSCFKSSIDKNMKMNTANIYKFKWRDFFFRLCAPFFPARKILKRYIFMIFMLFLPNKIPKKALDFFFTNLKLSSTNVYFE